LVHQPAAAPIEGFSNPLWTLSFVPMLAADLFDPVMTPKIVAVFCVAVGFLILAHTLRRYFELPALGITAVLLLVAANPAFVIWSVSG
jgi:hypothetical protein